MPIMFADNEDQPLSNARHERFAQYLAAGMPQVEAYEKAGYSRDDGNADRLTRNDSIRQRLAYLHRRNVAKMDVAAAGVTVEGQLAKLEAVQAELKANQAKAEEIRAGAMAAGQFDAATHALAAATNAATALKGAIVDQSKLGGLWVERSERTSLKEDPRQLTDAELDRIIAEEQSKAGGVQ